MLVYDVVANDASGSFILDFVKKYINYGFRCETNFSTLILTTPRSIHKAEPITVQERNRTRYLDTFKAMNMTSFRMNVTVGTSVFNFFLTSTLEQINTIPSMEINTGTFRYLLTFSSFRSVCNSWIEFVALYGSYTQFDTQTGV